MNEKITNLEYLAIIFFVMRASFLGITFNDIVNTSNQDNWIAIIIAIILGFLPLLLITYIINYKPELNIFEKNKILLGSILGNSLNLILTILFLIISIIVFYNLNIFITSQYLNKTPTTVINIVFIITIFYICSKKISVIARSFLILFFLGITLFLIVWLGLIPKISINNLKPFFITKNSSLMYSSLIYLSYNILPIFLITVIPKKKLLNQKKATSTIIISYLITNLTLLIVSITTIGTLGISLSKLFEYPEFHVLKYIVFIGFESRFDSIIFMHWVFDMICFITITIYFFSTYIKTTFKFNNKPIISLIGLLLISFPQRLIKNITLLDNISRNILPFIISIILLITLLTLSITIKKGKCLKNSKV